MRSARQASSWQAGLVVAVEAIRRLISPSGTPNTHWYVFAVVAIALTVDLTRTVISLPHGETLREPRPALKRVSLRRGHGRLGSCPDRPAAVRAGFAQGDATAALVIAAIILATAARLIAENANVLMDRTPSEARKPAERALARLEPDIELRALALARVRRTLLRGRDRCRGARSSGGRGPPGREPCRGRRSRGALPGSDVVVHVEPRRHRPRSPRPGTRAASDRSPEPTPEKEVDDITIYENGR